MLRERKVYTHYNPAPVLFEVNSGDKIVDCTGYIPPKDRIKNLIRSGEELIRFRSDQYDFGENDPDDGLWMDPLRKPGLDYSDISSLQGRALSNLRDQAMRNRSEEAEISETIAEASPSAVPEPVGSQI